MQALPVVSLTSMLLAFIPSIGVILIIRAWSLNTGQAAWANVRMLVQLLAVGYVLTFVFETEDFRIIVAVILLMMSVAAWITLRPLEHRSARKYFIALATIGFIGLLMLLIVTQWVLELPRWYEPRFVVPIAGMIFANAMNTTSLAAERFESEMSRGEDYLDARTTAMDAGE